MAPHSNIPEWLRLRGEHMGEWLPDLADPATLGAFVGGLLPEAWRLSPHPVTGAAMPLPFVWIEPMTQRVWFRVMLAYEIGGPQRAIANGETPLDAVVAALEAAPVRS